MSVRSRKITWSEYDSLIAPTGKLPSVGRSCTYLKTSPGVKTWVDKPKVASTCDSGSDTCLDVTNIRLSGGRWSGGGKLNIAHTYTKYGAAQVICLGYPVGSLMLGDCDVEVRALLGNWHLSYYDANKPVASANRTETYGSQAWNRYKPGKPNAGLSVFLAEIRDVPRALRDANMFLKSIWNKKYVPSPSQLGNDYIAYQFGMAPFVRDVKKFIDLASNFEKRLDDLRRLNGQWIKRSGSVASRDDILGRWQSGYGYYGFDWAPNTSTIIPSQCGATGTATYTERIWFSGRFRYAIPEVQLSGGKMSDKLNLARKMAGLSITPAVVWEVIPWSWLIDYFLHIGDLLENLDSGVASECAAKYAYLMNTSEIRCEQQSSAAFKHGAGISGVAEKVTITKTRIAASPFGFGLTGDLNAGQLSILAALGLARDGRISI